MSHWRHRLSGLAIPRLTLLLIAGQIIVFVLAQTPALRLDDMALIPARVLDGELWRLLTFLFWPPQTGAIWLFFAWYVFYLMGTALEEHWGTVRFNAYILVAYVATVLVAFLQPNGITTNAFIAGSVFLAFAWLYPDFEFYMFFILPVKVKYLAMLTWLLYGLRFISGSWLTRLLVLASVSNFLLFFGRDIWQRLRSRQRHTVAKAEPKVAAEQPIHRCTICGITDLSHPQMDFRYCSKCVGTHGYCEQHLRDHPHITAPPAAEPPSPPA